MNEVDMSQPSGDSCAAGSPHESGSGLPEVMSTGMAAL